MIKTEAEGAGQMITAEQMAEIEKGITVKGELQMTLSPNMPAGTKLKNNTMRMRMGPMNFVFNLWDIKIAGKETITVPAGTFECLKVTYVQKVNMGGNVVKMDNTDWYAEGIGIVRGENSDKKNGTSTTVVLKSITKPE